MLEADKSRVIYGDAPFIEDMGVLTTLCLLHDEVLLFGTQTLAEELQDYWERPDAPTIEERTVAERMFETLLPEGVVSFYSPREAQTAFPHSNRLELSGILGFEEIEAEGGSVISIKMDPQQLNGLSCLLLQGVAQGNRTVSSMLRDVSMLSAAWSESLPVVYKAGHVTPKPSSSRVSEVATFLAHRTLQRLALPELQAYEPDDILETRVRLKSELLQFRAGMLELVWLLHQKQDIGGDLRGMARNCDVLIDSKIVPAISQLERAIKSHENKRVSRILKLAGGAALDVGKSLLTGGLSSAIMGSSGALLKVAEGLEAREPSAQVASFIYNLRRPKL
jgi:hypothetical protein